MTYVNPSWTEVTNTKLIGLFSKDCELVRSFGVTYLQHPHHGDEAPVYARVGSKVFNTNDYDLPQGWAEG